VLCGHVIGCTRCAVDLDPACKSRTFEVVAGSAECRDYQELKIQEQIQKIGFGSIPRAIMLIIEDDLVDVCQPGDDILTVGVAICRWDRLLPGRLSLARVL
jgi:DNA helicase MCM9